MSSTADREQLWDSPSYQRIADARIDGRDLLVTFENGDVVHVERERLVLPHAHGANWDALEFDPFEIRIPLAGDDLLELSWLRFRALSDGEFASHLATAAEDEARRIGLRLRVLRERTNLSSKDVAERAGITPQSLSRIEHGRHDVVFTTLQRILAAMGSDLRDLAALEEHALSSKQIVERLRRFGLDTSLISRLTGGAGSQPERFLDRLERIFRWSPADLASDGTLPLRPSAAFAGRFKNQRRKQPAQTAYVVYAHYLAMLAAQAAGDIPVADLPNDPQAMRHEVAERYGGLRFEHILRWTWDHGIPVLPLFDPGQFHGACWMISGRPVICLKQRTPFEARWAFDLGHETGHVSRHLSAELGAVLELGEITPFGDSDSTASAEQEEEASDFAGELLLGDPEALAERVVEVAHGKVEWLKRAVSTVAKDAGVETDALANYLAYRLSRQGFNDWWGVATNLQEVHQDAPEIARREFLRRLDLDALADDDRDLLQAALVPEN